MQVAIRFDIIYSFHGYSILSFSTKKTFPQLQVILQFCGDKIYSTETTYSTEPASYSVETAYSAETTSYSAETFNTRCRQLYTIDTKYSAETAISLETPRYTEMSPNLWN